LSSTTNLENSLSIAEIQKNSDRISHFKNTLLKNGFYKFDFSSLNKNFCYDAYSKEFIHDGNLKYIIICYFYNLKGIHDFPEAFEFSFETQIETHMGIISIESTQWVLTSKERSETLINYFQQKSESIWEITGKNFIK
jgi:hypothetical protein